MTLVASLGAVAGCKRGAAATPAPPVEIPLARAAYVTDNGSDTVSVIDLGGTAVVSRSVDIDKDAHEAPHHLAISRKQNALFVALGFPPPPTKTNDPHASHGAAEVHGKLARLDLATLTVQKTVDVDENPGDVVVTHDETRVLVTHFDMKRAMTAAAAGGLPSTLFASLQVWDAAKLTKIAERPLCVAPHGMAITQDDKAALVACYGSDEVAWVDLTSPTLATTRVPVGPQPGVLGAPKYGPYSVTLSRDGRIAAVANLEGADVRIFDVATKKMLPEAIFTLGARAFMPDFLDDGTLLVPLQSPDGLARLDLKRGTIERRVTFTKDVCGLPHVVRRAKDGRVFLVCEGDHTAKGSVLAIDPVTLETRARYAVGVYPDGIVFGDP